MLILFGFFMENETKKQVNCCKGRIATIYSKVIIFLKHDNNTSAIKTQSEIKIQGNQNNTRKLNLHKSNRRNKLLGFLNYM